MDGAEIVAVSPINASLMKKKISDAKIVIETGVEHHRQAINARR